MSRPASPAANRTGTLRLTGGAGAPPSLLHVPARSGSGPSRLVVLLHGAGGTPRRTVELLRAQADRDGFVLLVPKSRQSTWDFIRGGFGPDVENVDALLRRTSRRVAISGHTVAGFSDGASYALTLGIANGDVFDSVVAFSPGFSAPRVQHGHPRVFVSHGTDDQVLPIERCSRRLVPRLERQGYDVTYEEFEGGHEVPRRVREHALAWLEAPGT